MRIWSLGWNEKFFAVTKEEEEREEILLYKGKFPREILL